MKHLILISLLLTSSFLFSQNNCNCCESAYKQFDFWVGDWNVTDAKGNNVGENHISKIENNCLIVEKWKGTSKSTGTSMNYYDKSNDSWNQLWVDNSGTILKLKGNFVNGKMILKSGLLTSKKGTTYYNKISWTLNSNQTVTQLWETYDKNHTLLGTLFKGIYTRKN